MYLSTIESKKTKQTTTKKQRQNRGCGEGFDGCQIGGGIEEMGEEVRGLISTN